MLGLVVGTVVGVVEGDVVGSKVLGSLEGVLVRRATFSDGATVGFNSTVDDLSL